MIAVPFLPEHLTAIALQPRQPKMALFTSPEYGASLATGGDARTYVEGDAVVACIGAFVIWEGRAAAWALLSADCGPHLPAITFQVRRYLRESPFPRVEAYIEASFNEAIRWAELLGFVRETPEPMKRFLPSGEPHYLYAYTRAD